MSSVVPGADGRHFKRYVVPSFPSSSASPPRSNEGLMTYPSLSRGLRRREADEKVLRGYFRRAQDAANAGDRVEMAKIAEELSKITYGNTTADQRREFLERYGCAKYTEKALDTIKRMTDGRQGVLEMGAGNGQWSRKLEEMGLDVLAFDDMSALPLPLNLYHVRTKPNQDFFYQKLRQGNEEIFQLKGEAKSRIEGRVLLIVFPDAGSMALDTLKAYEGHSELNDCFIYVGEGRGGANAEGAFFDYLEAGGKWVLVEVLDLEANNKGHEKMFVFLKKPPPAGKE